MFKGGIIRFKDELRNLPPKCKNKVKNEFYRKWEKEFIKLELNYEAFQKQKKEEDKRMNLNKQRKYLNRLKKEKRNEIFQKKEETENEFFEKLKQIQKEQINKIGFKDKENEKENELNKRKVKKKYNRSVSNEKNEIVKSNKKYYCSGFNMYKEIIKKKKRNVNSKE